MPEQNQNRISVSENSWFRQENFGFVCSLIFGYRNSKQNECDTNKTNLFTHHDLVCMPVVINATTNLSTCHKSELMNSNHYIYYLISLKAIKFNPVSNLDKLRPCPSTMDQICLKLNNNFHKT